MATVTLRPNATRSTTGVTVTGAGSEHAALSDQSDSSYVGAPTTSAAVSVDLDTTTLAAGSVTKTVVVGVRAKSDSTSPAAATATLRNAGGTSLATLSTGSVLTAAATDYESAVFAVTLAQADVDGLYVDLGFGLVASPPPYGARMFEAWIDLVVASIPTVTAVAPSGTITDTTRPTVEWTYTAGDEADDEYAWQVRTFSAAEYGIGGFDPETSPCSDESGITYSVSLSYVTGDALPNGVSYRSYVRAAALVNGSLQWSAWSYTAFTLDADVPAVLSVTGTASDADGWVRLVVVFDDAAPDPTSVEIERSDDDGVTWVPVRGATRADTYGSIYVNYDHEAPPSVACLWRARGTRTVAEVDSVGDWTVSDPVSWTATGTWLKSPADPTVAGQTRFTVMPAPNRARTTGVFEVLGRSDYVVVTDVRRTQSGTLEFTTMTAAEADELLTLLEETTLLIQSPAAHGFGQRYVVVGGVSEARRSRSAQVAVKSWTAEYWEIARPADTGVVWVGGTWDSVVASYSSWTAVIAANAEWVDLL